MGMPLEASDQWNSENGEIDKRKEEREMREFVVYSLYLLFLHNCLFIAVKDTTNIFKIKASMSWLTT